MKSKVWIQLCLLILASMDYCKVFTLPVSFNKLSTVANGEEKFGETLVKAGDIKMKKNATVEASWIDKEKDHSASRVKLGKHSSSSKIQQFNQELYTNLLVAKQGVIKDHNDEKNVSKNLNSRTRVAVDEVMGISVSTPKSNNSERLSELDNIFLKYSSFTYVSPMGKTSTPKTVYAYKPMKPSERLRDLNSDTNPLRTENKRILNNSSKGISVSLYNSYLSQSVFNNESLVGKISKVQNVYALTPMIAKERKYNLNSSTYSSLTGNKQLSYSSLAGMPASHDHTHMNHSAFIHGLTLGKFSTTKASSAYKYKKPNKNLQNLDSFISPSLIRKKRDLYGTYIRNPLGISDAKLNFTAIINEVPVGRTTEPLLHKVINMYHVPRVPVSGFRSNKQLNFPNSPSYATFQGISHPAHFVKPDIYSQFTGSGVQHGSFKKEEKLQQNNSFSFKKSNIMTSSEIPLSQTNNSVPKTNYRNLSSQNLVKETFKVTARSNIMQNSAATFPNINIPVTERENYVVLVTKYGNLNRENHIKKTFNTIAHSNTPQNSAKTFPNISFPVTEQKSYHVVVTKYENLNRQNLMKEAFQRMIHSFIPQRSVPTFPIISISVTEQKSSPVVKTRHGNLRPQNLIQKKFETTATSNITQNSAPTFPNISIILNESKNYLVLVTKSGNLDRQNLTAENFKTTVHSSTTQNSAPIFLNISIPTTERESYPILITNYGNLKTQDLQEQASKAIVHSNTRQNSARAFLNISIPVTSSPLTVFDPREFRRNSVNAVSENMRGTKSYVNYEKQLSGAYNSSEIDLIEEQTLRTDYYDQSVRRYPDKIEVSVRFPPENVEIQNIYQYVSP